MMDGQQEVQKAWEELGSDCGYAFALDEEAKKFKKENYPSDTNNSSQEAYNKCARMGVDAKVDQIQYECFEVDPATCKQLGEDAAAVIVFQEVCVPTGGTSYSNGNADYEESCREFATNVCTGEVSRKASAYCPDVPLTTSDLLRLQDMCEDVVDDLTGAALDE